MKRIFRLHFIIVISILLHSCYISHDREIICQTNFKKARDLAYKNPTNPIALDSALIIANQCMYCDSIKKAVVDFKITLLATLNKFKEGTDFIDSLQFSDFKYPYKKKLYRDNFIALNFATKKDIINRNKTLEEMNIYLEKYINSSTLNDKEFKEVFTDLFSLKANFIDSVTINKQVDSLKIKYPSDTSFFNFFRK